MNQVERLISKLCPEGVRHHQITDVFEIRNGYTPSKAKEGYWNNGTIPWIRLEDIRTFGRVLDCATQYIHESGVRPSGVFQANSIIISTLATIGEHALVTVPFTANQQITILTINEKFTRNLDPKFAFYYCFNLAEYCRAHTSTSGFASVNMRDFKKFSFPVPPLEVQQEIMRILDTFTKLDAELEAELEARKIQYSEFLRTTFDFSDRDEVRWTEIGEVCSTFSGAFVKKTEQDDNFEYPVFNGGSTATGYYSDFNSPENSIAISARGSIGAVNWVPTKFWAGNSCHVVLATDPKLNNRFLYHYLKFHEPSLYALRAVGSIPALNLKPLLKFPVPLPPLEMQSKISGVLDKFETLINDISIGLPGEIAARRQQYEYYRSKLLTFKELEVA